MSIKAAENALRKITIHNLQRLRNVTLEFPLAGVTAIIGENGSGKSTVLRALACIYQPKQSISLSQKDYRPSQFFVPYAGYDWSGCRYDAWIEGQDECRSFAKEIGGSWLPNPTTRFHRYVKYIGIGDSIPHIEMDPDAELAAFTREGFWSASDARSRAYLRKVSETLNRNYQEVGRASKTTGALRQFMFADVQDKALGSLNYPSHYMGAGEQKIFDIVREVVQAPKGALILIEEPEVSLHNKAMADLLVFLQQQAEMNALQIVISTHWLGIPAFAQRISFYSLVVDRDTESVRCRSGVSPTDFIAVSGDHANLKRITVWVEDVLARSIVDHIANHLGIREFIKKIHVARSAQNLFSVAAAQVIERDHVDDLLIVGDGDRDTSNDEKHRAMESLIDISDNVPIDGPQDWVGIKRRQAAALISEFAPPGDTNPEDFFFGVATRLNRDGQAPEWLRRDLETVSRIRPQPTGKQAFYELAKVKSDSDNPENVRDELKRLHERFIQEVSRTPEWDAYIAPVASRLMQMCVRHGLIQLPNITDEPEEVAA